MPDKYTNYAIQRNYQFETHDKNGNLTSNETEVEWRQRVSSEWTCSNLKAKSIAYIFHDKDINDDGTSKGLHVHGVISFTTGIPQSNAMMLSKCSSPQNCAGVKNKVSAYRYLIHVTNNAINECKHIYSPSDVVCLSADPNKPFNYAKAMSQSKSREDEKESLKMLDKCLEDVTLGKATLPEIEIYKKDTYDLRWSLSKWHKDKSKYAECEKEYMGLIDEYYQTHNRCLTTVYINGEGGSGKTTIADALALKFADKRGIHKVAAPGLKTTFDFAGTYHGEAVSVFNELSGDAFSPDQFCSIFDPKHAESVNSRNYDKPWFARYAIFTTSRCIEEFIYDMWLPFATKFTKLGYDKYFLKTHADWLAAYEKDVQIADKIRQVRRRFAIYVRIVDAELYIYIRNDAYNPRHIFIYDNYTPNEEPFALFATMPFNVNNPKDIDLAVDGICAAIPAYYKFNKYSITPSSTPPPSLKI